MQRRFESLYLKFYFYVLDRHTKVAQQNYLLKTAVLIWMPDFVPRRLADWVLAGDEDDVISRFTIMSNQTMP